MFFQKNETKLPAGFEFCNINYVKLSSFTNENFAKIESTFLISDFNFLVYIWFSYVNRYKDQPNIIS
jgi:hypothetical protein